MSTHGPHVELLYFPECPHWQVADERLREVASRLGLTIEYLLVTSAEDAERVSFRGSPTILIDGVDPFAVGDEPNGLPCRIYRTPDGYAGSPTTAQIAAALGAGRSGDAPISRGRMSTTRSYSTVVTTGARNRVLVPVPFDPDAAWGHNRIIGCTAP